MDNLKRKGWSARELAHARKVVKATALPREQARLWLLVLLTVLGSACLSVFLLPLLLFAPLWFVVPVILLLGVLFGLMLVNTLLSLRIIHKHHVKAYLFLLAASFLALLFATHILLYQFASLPAHHPHALLVAAPYLIGLSAPYTLERRLHGPT